MKLNNKILLPSIFRMIAMFAPFLFLKIVIDQNRTAALLTEVLLAWASFGNILIDWSSVNLLGRSHKRILAAGAFASLLVGKLVSSCVVLFIIYLIAVIFGSNISQSTIIAAGILLISTAIDPSWIYLGKRKIWIPQLMGITRYAIAIGLLKIGWMPTLALAIGFLSTSAAFTLPINSEIKLPKRISFGLYRIIIKRYRVLAITDLFTSIFSKYDVPIAAMLMTESHALVYAVCRKMIAGLQGVAFASAPLIYMEREKVEATRQKKDMKNLMYLIMLFGIGAMIFACLAFYHLKSNLETFSTIGILAFLLPIGYKKTLLQFGHLYRMGKYREDFQATVLSSTLFIVQILVLNAISWCNPPTIGLSRLLAEISYIYFIKQSLKTNHAV